MGTDSAAGPKIFAREYYRRLFELEDIHWWSHGMREVAERLITSHFTPHDQARLLDAGCGTGRVLRWLEKFAPADRIVGIDLSPYALELCLSRGLRRLVMGSVLSLPFADATFGLVTCFDVIQHLPRDVDGLALREFLRVLRPGGLICLRTNVRLTRRSSNPGWEVPGDFRQYTREEVESLFRCAGFELITLTYANMLPALAYALVRNVTGWRQAAPGVDTGLPLRRTRRWVNALLLWITRGEARYLAGGRRTLPCGHSMICLARRPDRDGGS